MYPTTLPSFLVSLQDPGPPFPPPPFADDPYIHSSPWGYPAGGSPPKPTIQTEVNNAALVYSLLVLIPMTPFLVAGVCLFISRGSNNGPSDVISRDDEAVIATTTGLNKEVIESFPTMLYSEVKLLSKQEGVLGLECAICLSPFDDADTLRLLPGCSHAFHPECIDKWLDSQATCPVCREDLTPPPDHQFDAAETTEQVQVRISVEEVAENGTVEEARDRLTSRLPGGVLPVWRRVERSGTLDWRKRSRRWRSFDMAKPTDGWATLRRTWSLRSSGGLRDEGGEVGDSSRVAVACGP